MAQLKTRGKMLSREQSNRFATMNLSTRQSMLMGIWHGMVVQFPAISSQSNGKFSSFVGVRDCRLDTWGRFLGFPDNDPGREVELVGTRATRCYNTTNPWFPFLPKKPWTCLQTTNILFVGIEIFLQNKRQERNFQFVSCFRGSQNHFRALLLNLVSSRLPCSFPPAQLKQALKHKKTCHKNHLHLALEIWSKFFPFPVILFSSFAKASGRVLPTKLYMASNRVQQGQGRSDSYYCYSNCFGKWKLAHEFLKLHYN